VVCSVQCCRIPVGSRSKVVESWWREARSNVVGSWCGGRQAWVLVEKESKMLDPGGNRVQLGVGSWWYARPNIIGS